MLKILVPIRSKADEINTHNVVDNVIYCVSESLYEEYYNSNPQCEFLVNPDAVEHSLSSKKQWMLEQYDDIFILDDDIDKLVFLAKEKGEKIEEFSKKDVYDIILQCHDAAQDLGAYMYGFSNYPNALYYRSHNPVKVSGSFLGCGMGIRSVKDSRLFFDKRMNIGEDVFICLVNAYYNRFVYKDSRFFFSKKNKGEVLTSDRSQIQENCLKYLKEMFGDSVKVTRKKGGAKKLSISLPF